MLEAISDAIKAEQFETADQLLQSFKVDQLDNPWVDYYEARLAEARGDWAIAQDGYRQLIPLANNHKLIAKLRQGLERLDKQLEEQRKQEQTAQKLALERIKTTASHQELGIFILESIPPELKQTAAVNFAKIMQTDPYTARLQLPSRSWRLYRTGDIQELRFYVEKLQAVNIPCFCIPVSQLLDLTIKPVFYFSEITPNPTIVYRLNKDEDAIFSFSWSKVSQRVEGLLPIFEECLEANARGKMERKTKIQDYARICDLHLPDRQMIIRLCDRVYEFDEGISMSSSHGQREITSNEQWNYLINAFKEKMLDKPSWTEFNPFAENAIDFKELLKLIDPHTYFLRREESDWDRGFHLYSSLIFCRSLLP
ncbi:MAG: hypothetical protein ACKO4S_17765 [Snowella sp.]